MGAIRTLAVTGLAWLAVATTASADVQVSIQGGLVTIVARDATVRQILAEWARVGRTSIVNLERIGGGPTTLELRDVPEQQALDVLLRLVSGYLAAPRSPYDPAASVFERIVVMPTSTAPRTSLPTPAPAPFRPSPARPPLSLPEVNDTDSEGPDNGDAPPQRPPFATFPQPQVVYPPPQGVPADTPGMVPSPPQQQGTSPATVFPSAPPGAQPANLFGAQPRPGMIAPPPQQAQPVVPVPPPPAPDEN
jgi:hypothetical protein